MGVMLTVIVISMFGRNYERVPAWPRHKYVGVPAAVFGVIVLVALWYLVIRPKRWKLLAVVAAVAFVGAYAVGWPMQRHYFNNRYAHARLPLDEIYAPFRHISDSSVAYYGTLETYPFFGPDLSNHVARPPAPAVFDRIGRCRAWLDELSKYHYIVITHQAFAYDAPPEFAIAHDRSVTPIAGRGASVLYRVNRPLEANAC